MNKNVKKMTYGQAIRLGMTEEMKGDEKIILIGQDDGLLKEFGQGRIFDPPSSEGALVATAVGAAMTGLRPIYQMKVMDFVTLGMEALVNQGAKMRYMFGGQAQIPLVLRLPVGSGAGGAAQHSQSLEAWLCHVPGLKVVSPATPEQAKGLIKAAIRDNNPVCFIEHERLYEDIGLVPLNKDFTIGLGKTLVEREGGDVTLVTYGRMLKRALKAADFLSEEGIELEILNPLTLYPMEMGPIIESVVKTGRVIIAHEASKTGGLGGEIAARIAESDAFDYLDAPIIRLGGLDVPIPYNQALEASVLPQKSDFVQAVYKLMNRD